jgi:murein DD-endopeptidase MepM/ murein hydrolase activator NlpD
LSWILRYLGKGVLSASLALGGGHNGGGTPHDRCISPDQYDLVRQQIRAFGAVEPNLRQDLLFEDPLGGGGINSPGKTTVNYVDWSPSDNLLDYSCGSVTYDSHQGTDIELLDFYDMDEGVPILSAASGHVIYRHDGEFDRRTAWVNGVQANGVIVQQSDGSEAWYWHMRKNSVRVAVSDSVSVVDTLGLVGSSGFSSGPHLHFEINQNTILDPYQGPCQTDSSRWAQQPDYILNLPFQLMSHGLTTLPLSWALVCERPPTKTHITAGDTLYSWLRLRNVKASDQLTWKFYYQGSLWNSYTFSPGTTYPSSWWYIWWILPTTSNFYGNWTLKIYHNNDFLTQQDFLYDGTSNQPPLVDNQTIEVLHDSLYRGEFTGQDPDGSIFWFIVDTLPRHGTLYQSGGRKRKYRYTPTSEFTGSDTLWFHAVDDENVPGPKGTVIFEVRSTLAIAPLTNTIPNSFRLGQNYPNPFNSTTVIPFQLTQATTARIVIYNLTGEQVEVILQGYYPPGKYQVTWNSQDVSSGLYFYQMITSTRSSVRKLVVIK